MLSYEIKQIKINDPLYPELLKNIVNPPKVLYYAGTFPSENLFPLAVVGSRQHDNYGELVINQLLTNDILNKVVIISGLALGIDALAHKIAKQTIAVLGSGLDKDSFYPKGNWSLCEKIINNGGLVLSEYPPGTPPRAENFPQRNRIVAGLSRAVLVVQARKRSGALITARLALESGRDVLTVPGSIFNELSQGPHLLLAQGAIPVTNAIELNEILNLS